MTWTSARELSTSQKKIKGKENNAEQENPENYREDDGDWGKWSQKSEEWLLTFYEVNKAEYRGRGQADIMEKRTISAPQHPKDGHAHNARGRELQRRLQQTKRLRYLEKEGRNQDDWEEQRNLQWKLGQKEHEEAGELAEKINKINDEIRQHRTKEWNQWVKDNLQKPKNIFDWVK